MRITLVKFIMAFVLILRPFSLLAQESDWERYFTIFDEAYSNPPIKLARLTQELDRKLAMGSYSGIIFGETHFNPDEFKAVKRMLANLRPTHRMNMLLEEMSSGEPPYEGIFSQPVLMNPGRAMASQYDNRGWLKRARIDFKGVSDIYDPGTQLKKVFSKMKQGDVLLAYCGNMHAAALIADYRRNNFNDIGEFDTVERVFKKHGKRPVIVAMIEEKDYLVDIQNAMIKTMPSHELSALERKLNLAVEFWRKKTSAMPKLKKIRFALSKSSPELYLGMSSGYCAESGKRVRYKSCGREPIVFTILERFLDHYQAEILLTGEARIKDVDPEAVVDRKHGRVMSRITIKGEGDAVTHIMLDNKSGKISVESFAQR
ncbi:hypothetical protein ACFL6Y_02290 [Elusimicrobiota bacterium]